MRDRSLLHLPFFDAELEGFAAALGGWMTTHGRECARCHPEVSNRAGAATSCEETTKHYVRELAAQGFLQASVEPNARKLCIARETLAYYDALADFAFAMQGLGGQPIRLFGTPAQQHEFLSGIAAGKTIAAFALSEREAGSDVGAIAARAVRDGDSYVINGEKTWISNAGIADLYVLFARTADAGNKGLSAFIVPASTAGLSVSERIETISPHPLGTLQLQDCRIPADRRLGEEGAGFKIAMSTLDLFRPAVGAAAVGFARRALDESIAHVRDRKLFGAPLASMQLTQAKIAQMATEIDASALLVYRAAYAKDCGAARITREAAMAKWYATEAASRAADAAVQLFGGRGVTRGEIAERLYRDVRALRIYEGASEIQQIVIARSLLEER